MTTSEINSLINELNRKISWYADNRKLFAGGCCYAAYLLARGFEKLGVKYTTIIYQDGPNWNTNKFRKVCYGGDGCGHVAIRVVYKHKKFEIGSRTSAVDRMTAVMSHYGKWMAREYRKVTSDDLKDMYWSNDWNETWDTDRNGVLAMEIGKIFAKYM